MQPAIAGNTTAQVPRKLSIELPVGLLGGDGAIELGRVNRRDRLSGAVSGWRLIGVERLERRAQRAAQALEIVASLEHQPDATRGAAG